MIRRHSRSQYYQPQTTSAEQQKSAEEKPAKPYDPKKSFLQPIPPFNPNNRKRLEEKEREKALQREREERAKRTELEQQENEKQMDLEKETAEQQTTEQEHPHDAEQAAL